MDNIKEINKQKESHSYLEITDYMEETDSHSYKSIRHNKAAFGGDAEYQDMIDRYKKAGVEITDQEKETLRENMPPAPDFRVLDKNEYEAKGRIGRHKYNKDVKNYMKKRKKYFESKPKENSKNKEKNGAVFSKLRDQLEEKYRYNITEEGLLKRHNDLYKEIEADADAMDAAYEKMKSKEFEKAEREIGEASCREAFQKDNAEQHIVNYTGPYYGQMNTSLREEQTNPFMGTTELKNFLNKQKLSRDLVVRRGIRGLDTIAAMLGMKNANNLTENEIKDALKEQLENVSNGKDVFIYDKGFMSTSLPYIKNGGFAATGQGKYNIGIEFIILCRKGTHAMNISSRSSKKSEEEVLINAGTKLRIVDARIDEDDNKIITGEKKSWKIYLETVPGSEDGLLREEN